MDSINLHRYTSCGVDLWFFKVVSGSHVLYQSKNYKSSSSAVRAVRRLKQVLGSTIEIYWTESTGHGGCMEEL